MGRQHVRAIATLALVLAAFSGRVIDEGNSRALDGVRVHADGPTTAEATTDRAGRFTMTNLKPGPYTITTESDDVPLQEFHVTLVNNRASALDMKVCSLRFDAHCGPPARGLP